MNERQMEHARIQRLSAVQELVSTIEMPKETASTVELDDNALESLAALLEKIASDENCAVPVIRLWNKKKEDIVSILSRISEMRESGLPIAGVFFSINKTAESGDLVDKENTRDTIASVVREGGIDYPVVPLNVHKYTWTAGLNAPAAILVKWCQQHDISLDSVYQLNLSADAEMDLEGLKQLRETIQKGEVALTVRKDTDIQDQEAAYEVLQSALKKIHGRESVDPQSVASIMRNTGLAVPLSMVNELGGWDNRCNAWGGMEDQDFAVRGLRYLLSEGKIGAVKNLLKSDPIMYKDMAWEGLSREQRDVKLRREAHAIEEIGTHLTSEEERMRTPESFRDFVFSGS